MSLLFQQRFTKVLIYSSFNGSEPFRSLSNPFKAFQTLSKHSTFFGNGSESRSRSRIRIRSRSINLSRRLSRTLNRCATSCFYITNSI